MTKPSVRRQSEYTPLTKEQFRARFDARFYDPAFDTVRGELDKVFEVAWSGYIDYRKSPQTTPVGNGFAEPDFHVALEWLKTKEKIDAAEKHQKNPKSPSRILIVNASTRSEHSCPGEISKTRRLAQRAQGTIETIPDYEVDFLDISTLADEPMKVIYPYKACFSTSPA
ncbi:MAG: NADPH-dependent FMN reductase, partial [Bdellovibrionales bacterium CG11_big_fil_rev_8_21_14_0_20_38_13]